MHLGWQALALSCFGHVLMQFPWQSQSSWIILLHDSDGDSKQLSKLISYDNWIRCTFTVSTHRYNCLNMPYKIFLMSQITHIISCNQFAIISVIVPQQQTCWAIKIETEDRTLIMHGTQFLTVNGVWQIDNFNYVFIRKLASSKC